MRRVVISLALATVLTFGICRPATSAPLAANVFDNLFSSGRLSGLGALTFGDYYVPTANGWEFVESNEGWVNVFEQTDEGWDLVYTTLPQWVGPNNPHLQYYLDQITFPDLFLSASDGITLP